MYTHTYIIIRTPPLRPPEAPGARSDSWSSRTGDSAQDSSKGGAVETGCSGLHYITVCMII